MFKLTRIDIGNQNTFNGDVAGEKINKPGRDYIEGDQINYPPNKPIPLPITDEPNFIIILIRRLFEYLGVEKFLALIILSLFSSGYLGLKSFFDIFSGNFSNTNGTMLLALGMLLFFSTLFILGLYFTRTCEKCGHKFAIRKIKKLHLGSVKYGGSEHHDIKVTYICDYCKEVFNKEFIESEQLVK